MPKLTVQRSIKINAPKEVVYPAISDFNKWIIWSPWLIMEPEAKVTIAEDQQSYEWEGNRVGSGNMSIREAKENEYVHFDLNFLKPWKSSSSTSMLLSSVEGGTEVTWNMDSSLPFFLFWMKKMMMAFVGADYERGLDMLKAYVEQGEIHSKLEFQGVSDFDGCKWIGVKTTSSMDAIGPTMEADFGKLRTYHEANDGVFVGPLFTIYHKWDLVKNRVIYTAAAPVNEVPASLPEGFYSGEIAPNKVYKLRHLGAYQHLGNAWSTLYSMHRNKEFKPKKGIHPFEIYQNNPADTPEKELITDIHFVVQ